ncbi:LHFPL tetraspan subfamily member 7 protein [Microcaecilia unicolor]|uniref:Transmembrane protein 211 n=1 Tax=Microcaecilia unicolor TaxID=1415580 RepID=A0A6P7Z5V4_9AMPH|nr:transmembrane protein 211 [Microcaecilia unicolor]XP_030074723.1 transmembrane protein 211 [Microcaecilia unicolor]XP_030074724.1 transmembrane protein 211 [Microcaecilia unicolor]
MVSCMGSVWVTLSLALACISGFSLTSAAWFRNGTVSFGVFLHCYGPTNTLCNQTCTVYKTLDEIPDVSWQIAAVLLFTGWLLLVFGAVLILSWILIPEGLCQRRVCTPARYAQTAAVMATVLGLLIFPFSLDSAFAKEACGPSWIYYSGNCKLGWGFMMAIIAVMLSCLLPIIGRYNLNEIKTKIIFSRIRESILVTEDN